MAWDKTGNIKGDKGEGLAITDGTVRQEAGAWSVEVDDASVFAVGNYLAVSDGVNSLYGVVTYIGAGNYILLDLLSNTTGDPTLIPSGIVVTIAGPPGDTGPAGPGLPTGGSFGQLPVKLSGTDFDIGWLDSASILSDYYKLDGSQALTGQMDADGESIVGLGGVFGTSDGITSGDLTVGTGNPTETSMRFNAAGVSFSSYISSILDYAVTLGTWNFQNKKAVNIQELGVGTSTPTANLDVADLAPVIRLTDTYDANWGENQSAGKLSWYTSDGSGNGPMEFASIECKNHIAGGGTAILPNMVFSHVSPTSSGSSPIEWMRINEQGNVGIGTATPDEKLQVNGNIHADGIRFGTGTDLLDYYEKGTWTPTLVGENGGSAVSYTKQAGIYVRIGNKVHVSAELQLSSLGTSFSGRLSIRGIPFSAYGFSAGAIGYFTGMTNFSYSDIHILAQNTELFLYMKNTTNSDTSPLPFLRLTNSFRIMFSVDYMTA